MSTIRDKTRLKVKCNGAWSTEEDERCTSAVFNILKEKKELKTFERFGELAKLFPWKKISTLVITRTRKQCRDRFVNNLHPWLKKSIWSKEEDCLLKQLYSKYQNKWKTISKIIIGRSQNEVKMRWKTINFTSKKRKFEKISNFHKEKDKDDILESLKIDFHTIVDYNKILSSNLLSFPESKFENLFKKYGQ